MKLACSALFALAALAALPAHAAKKAPKKLTGLEQIQTVVVLYGENRSFDNLYGSFPGANGIANATAENGLVQRDRDGTVLATLPPVWQKVGVPDPQYPAAMPNAPFQIDAPPINLPLSAKTRDLTHRFYQNQMQINGGKNDMFVAWSDAGALTMGHYDGASLPLWKLAREYTLADNFFMGAFGGSYINHMWLACACTPNFPNAPDKMRAKLDANGRLMVKDDSPASAMAGGPKFQDGVISPDGYTINTVQPSYQPSLAKPAQDDPRLADPADDPLPPQTLKTIGDTLSDKRVTWKWYAGGYNAALKDRKQIYGGEVDFQPHHQPFNYFLRFAPGTKDRAIHLKDGEDMMADIKAGKLPQVTFYKPSGKLNEHPGGANVMEGDIHLADIVAKLKASPQWKHMAIIITYDENGGFWDHVAPPKGDRWGPGSRIPAIIISPYAKKGFVDHTPYDTTSILQFLTHRFKLEPLPGVRTQQGDLTNAFELNKAAR
ncbi:acid phosphatase [Massilia sp. R2A-15]|uniref:acid phosphatase n=1 Tax=Massilia sp. R2A-15 TaxID=3064278 RepID=UPI00273260E3|nr:acid phosphatase [Massilia sp. R2A-15]WLI87900.1 acid phosphatase [Massilia sp. R2A-15]